MTKILILYVDAGQGHRKVAEAVAEELKSRNTSELQVEVSDALEKTNWLFRCSYPVIYHRLVVWAPWLWGFFYYFTNLSVVYFLIAPLRSFWNWIQSGKLRRYLTKERFNYIVFTHFFPAEVCATAKKKGLIDSKLITIVTDVIPHAVWQNSGTDFYWVMASESAEVLLRNGITPTQIHPNGIPVSSEFLEKVDVSALKNNFGLKPNRLTVLFTSGSFGIGPTETVLDSFENLRDKIQALVVCGKNQTLFETLNRKRFPFPVVLFGFVDNMHELMSVADLLVAKPGGATTCESLAKKLPMVIMSPIPGQESYNAKWLVSRGAAFQIKDPGEIKDIVSKIVNQPHTLDAMKQAIERIAKPQAASDIANFILSDFKK